MPMTDIFKIVGEILGAAKDGVKDGVKDSAKDVGKDVVKDLFGKWRSSKNQSTAQQPASADAPTPRPAAPPTMLPTPVAPVVPTPVPPARLLIGAGPHANKQIQLTDDPLLLGKKFTDPNPDDQTISHKHAQVYWHDGEFWIQDLKSRNGTFVNGQRITQTALHHGDQIQIGQTALKFD